MEDEFDAGRALREIAPQRLPAALVTEAERIAGTRVALYVIDIDGSCFSRLAGAERFPESFPSLGAVGPELPLEALDRVRPVAASAVPGGELVPLALGERILGAFLSEGSPAAPLGPLAGEAALALELVSGYGDAVHSVRRHRRIDPAAEIQQNLLPPRIARLEGAELAGAVLPGYDVGGDFFDHAQNDDGLWLAVGDGMGKGNNAAALASLAIGALRSARRSDATVPEAAARMHTAVYDTIGRSHFLTVIVALWDPGTRELSWVNAGHPPPLRLDAAGAMTELVGERTHPLGLFRAERSFPLATQRLEPGDRLVLYSDGITERRDDERTRLGVEGLQATLRPLAGASAATTVAGILESVRRASSSPLTDDATLLVLALDS